MQNLKKFPEFLKIWIGFPDNSIYLRVFIGADHSKSRDTVSSTDCGRIKKYFRIIKGYYFFKITESTNPSTGTFLLSISNNEIKMYFRGTWGRQRHRNSQESRRARKWWCRRSFKKIFFSSNYSHQRKLSEGV